MIHNDNHQRAAGFTIVELMVAMAFISLLLLAIAGAVIQIGGIYNKGLTMKSVNQSGRIVVTDMKRAIGESQPFTVPDTNDSSYGHTSPFILQSKTGIALPGDDRPQGGRLCLGVYSYAWNIGKELTNNPPNKYTGGDIGTQIRLIKVRDNGGQLCKGDVTSPIDATKATELLSQNDLAVQRFHIERLTKNAASGTALYSIGLTLSNADTEAINRDDNTCKAPKEVAVLQNYCSVNEFIFTARAGDRGAQ